MAQVASGEVATIERADLLPRGFVVTSSGRISGVTEPGELSVHYPFPTMDLVVLDDALKYGSRAAKARFAVYIGDLGDDTAATGAAKSWRRCPHPTTRCCWRSRRTSARSRWCTARKSRAAASSTSAPLGVSAAAAAFQDGNLIDGLISAVRVLSAGVSPP